MAVSDSVNRSSALLGQPRRERHRLAGRSERSVTATVEPSGAGVGSGAGGSGCDAGLTTTRPFMNEWTLHV